MTRWCNDFLFFTWRKLIQFTFFHDLLQPTNEKLVARSLESSNITFPLSMLHQEAVQTPRSRCGVVVLAMLLLVAIGIGRHRGGLPQLKKKSLPTKQLDIWKTAFFQKLRLGIFSLNQSPSNFEFPHLSPFQNSKFRQFFNISPTFTSPFFRGRGQGMLLNVQLAGVAWMVMDVRKPLLHGLDTLRGLLTDEAPRQFFQ